MGKRKGTLLSFASLLFAFMLATLFFYMVYNTHFDSATDDFTGLIVHAPSYESEPFVQKKQRLDTMKEELAAWASEHDAILFYKGFSAAGIAAIDYADWFGRTWNLLFTGQEPKTAVVQNNQRILDSYVENDILFPGVYDYQVVGLIGEKRIPTFQGNAFFYFPLSDLTDMDGMLFTNISDVADLRELRQIIEKTGRTVEYQTYSDSQSSIWDVLIQMFFDDFVSRSMLFTFLGLIFCAVFSVFMMYRESNRYLVVHHLYGATYLVLFMKTLFHLVCIAILGTILGYILGKTQLNLIHREAYINIAVISGICNILFVCLVQIMCFTDWARKNRGKEGRY